MGLDTYAVKKGQGEDKYIRLDDSLFEDIKYPLCGGMFSGQGNGSSFRGKVYDSFIKTISGVSLYQELMSSEDIEEIIRSLKIVLCENINKNIEFIKSADYDISTDEVYSLLKWFSVVHKNNGNVMGWW